MLPQSPDAPASGRRVKEEANAEKSKKKLTRIEREEGLKVGRQSEMVVDYLNNFVDGQRQDALDLFLGVRKVAVIEENKREEVLIQSRLWYVSLLVKSVKWFAPREVRSNFQFLQAICWSVFMVFAWMVLNLDGRVLTIHPTVPDEVDIPHGQTKNCSTKQA